MIASADATVGRDGAIGDGAAGVRAIPGARFDPLDYHRFLTARVLFGAEIALSSGDDDGGCQPSALELLVDLFGVDFVSGTRSGQGLAEAWVDGTPLPDL